jgi:hypothetical protein
MILHTEDLLSKWGFRDGDIMHEWLRERGLPEEDAQDLLTRIVMKYVIPEIAQNHAVKVNTIITSHNPIRLSQLDDEKDDFAIEWNCEINPLTVEVTDDCIKFEYHCIRVERTDDGGI